MLKTIKALCAGALLLSSLLSNNLKAQSVTVSNALGSSAFFKDKTIPLALTYAPRLNFYFFGVENTISVGLTPSVAASFSVISGGYSEKPLFAFDIPLTIDANFGHGSDDDADSDFGGFVGLGAAYNNMWSYYYDNIYTYHYTKRPNSFGFVAEGGVRIGSMYGDYEIRGSYLLSLASGSKNVISVGLLYNIGDF